MKSLARARSIVLTVLTVVVAVLVATGIALYFLYQPPAIEGSPGPATGEDLSVRLAHGLQGLHLVAAWLAVPTALAAAAVLALRAGAAARRWTGPALGAGLVVTTVGAFLTGRLLPWDLLALRTPTLDSPMRGYTLLFDPSVRFVIGHGVESSRATVQVWLAIHALVLGAAAIGLVALAWRRRPLT